MKNSLFILAVAGMLTLGCSSNQKNDAADADSNSIDTTMTDQSTENMNNGAMGDTTGMGSDTTRTDTATRMQ
ncbi:MAG: entericidin [Flavobacterium sp.]|nr:MAG: entericidin [Flavobacterium sp.]